MRMLSNYIRGVWKQGVEFTCRVRQLLLDRTSLNVYLKVKTLF